MANKTFKTRIMLKYDTLTNWEASSLILKKGEMAIATVADGISPVAKIGDGSKTFSQLSVMGALAADVYGWAKQESHFAYRIAELTDSNSKGTGVYELQVSESGKGNDWVKAPGTTNIDLGSIVADYDAAIAALEKRVGDLETATANLRTDLGNKDDAANAEGSAFARIAHLMGDGEGSIADQIGDRLGLLSNLNETLGANETLKTIKQSSGEVIVTKQEIAIPYSKVTGFNDGVGEIIKTLDSTAETEASNPIKIKVTQADGKLDKVITASITAGTYAPGNVLESLELEDKDVSSSDVATGKDGGISTLSYVDTVTQADGQVNATKKTVALNSPYSATNKVATMKDITDKATELMGDITGAMHFKGVSTTNPLKASGATVANVAAFEDGDVVLYTFVEADVAAGDGTGGLEGVTAEYVYSGKKWYKLGDESIAQKLIDALDMDAVSVGADETISSISQVNGQVAVVGPKKISIVHTQVSDFDAGVKEWVDANLDSKKTSTGPVKVTVTQVGGKITAVAASIDAGTYAPGNVLDGLNHDSDDVTASAASGTSITFVDRVQQVKGQVTAEKTTLVFNQAYNASSNKIATMADIPALGVATGTNVAVTADTVEVTAKLAAKDVTGHTITAPVAVVPTVAGVGNQISTRLELLDNNDAAEADKWVTAAVQVDGLVQVSRSAIAINQLAENTAENYVIFDCGNASGWEA